MAEEEGSPKQSARGSERSEPRAQRENYEKAGLCDRCVHAEIVRSKRSLFLRCRLADTDSRFDKYPRLPVLACGGFEAEVGDLHGRAHDPL